MARGQRGSRACATQLAAPPLPLETAAQCFALLVAGPHPPSVDGREFPGLPDRAIPLDELRTRLMRGQCPRRTRDAVWTLLIRRARAQGATWTLACAGMALPALSGICHWASGRFPAEPFDLQAEVLTGFLGALATIDLERPRPHVRPRWAAYRRMLAVLYEALDAPVPVARVFVPAPPKPPWGHPDFVLLGAVRVGVLTRTEADLIGRTRLEEQSVPDWAQTHDRPVMAAYQARRRAELRLRAYLTAEQQAPDRRVPACGTPVPTASAPIDSVADSGSRVKNSRTKRPLPSGAAPHCCPGARFSVSRWEVPAMCLPPVRSRARRPLLVASMVVVLLALCSASAFAAESGAVLALAKSVNEVLDNIRNWIMGVLAGLATVFLTVGGVRYVMAGGDPGEVEKAKTAFKSAGWGYGLAALAPLVVAILKGIVGA
ncbi:pilin [Streptomyces sp. NPDC055189]